MESFEYPRTLVENVQLLVQEEAGKNEVLASIQTYLYMADAALEEAN